jgi:hypothetical protein
MCCRLTAGHHTRFCSIGATDLPQSNAIALFGGVDIGDLSSSKNGIG